jgi:hypothetical protein
MKPLFPLVLASRQPTGIAAHGHGEDVSDVMAMVLKLKDTTCVMETTEVRVTKRRRLIII